MESTGSMLARSHICGDIARLIEICRRARDDVRLGGLLACKLPATATRIAVESPMQRQNPSLIMGRKACAGP